MANTTSFINQYFDHVYVINLKNRPDRKVAMFQKLSTLGIKAEFVQAIDGYSGQNKSEHQYYLGQAIGGKDSHPLEIKYQRKLIKSPGALGYLKTYLGILSDAKKRGFDRILCFDDDVLFNKDFENQFIKGILPISDDWKLLFLGASQYVWKIPQGLSYSDEKKNEIDANEPFYFPNSTDGSFAVGINRSVFDLLIHDILKMNCPFDSGPLRTVIDAFPKKCFVLNPNIVIADVSESDIREGQDQQQLAEQLKWNMSDYDFPFQQDLVSVIMPAFNAEMTIEKSVRSILIQSYRNIELIVVNDASTDNIRLIIEKIIEEDPRVRMISLSKNRGVGFARNEGINASKGKIITFQDADDISLKDRIAFQLIPIYEKGMLFSVCRFFRSRCTMEELNINDQDSVISLVESRRKETKSGIFEYRDRADIGLVTAMYKRSAFEDFGLFEDHRYGEDMEFVERILFHKLKIEFDENFNGHTFLSRQASIPKLYEQVDTVMYISPDMDVNNLTVQYEGKIKEKLAIESTFRKKHKSGGIDQFSKLSIKGAKNNFSNIRYNTIKLNTIILLPEIEHQIIQLKLEAAIEAKRMHPPIEEIYNSISWKITAPLRWMATSLKRIINNFK